MPAPEITPLPDPPLRSQDGPTFATAAETFVAALPAMVEETNAALAFVAETTEGLGSIVPEIGGAGQAALVEIANARSSALAAIAPQVTAASGYAATVTEQIKRRDLFPDTFFRELDPANPFYPKVTGKARRRLSGTWPDKIKSSQSPFESGFSLVRPAAVSSATIRVPVTDPGRVVPVGANINVALSMSGAGAVAITANWIGAGGNIGGVITFAPTVTLSGTAQTIANTATLTVPAGATDLNININHSGTAQDKYVHAIWAQPAATALLSDPAYREALPADIIWRIRDLEGRANSGVRLRRVSYSALATTIPVVDPNWSIQLNNDVGWGARFTPAGVSFNAVGIAGALRNSGTTNWRKLAVIVRQGTTGTSHQTGTIVAVGSIDLDPDVLSYGKKLIVPLRDPETDAFVTLTDANLGTEYFIGYLALDDTGQATSIGVSSGTTSNMVGSTGYRLQANAQNDPQATWATTTSSVGIEHLMLTNPANAYEPSTAFMAQVMALVASDPIFGWTAAPTIAYDSLTRQLAASDADATAVYGAAYYGFGGRYLPAGVSFNAIGLRRLSRNPAVATASNIPTSINVVVKAGTTGTTWSTGTIVAVGSVAVSPSDFEYRDLVIPLVDPVTGASKTLADADLGAQYTVAFYALTATGGNAQINPPAGQLRNAVAINEQFLFTAANGNPLVTAWGYSPSASNQPLEHLLITNPRAARKASYNLLTQAGFVDGALTLPPRIYGVQGREMNIYLDSLSPTELRDIDYRFQFGASQGLFYGQHQDERWTFTPGGTAINQAFTVFAYDRKSGELIGSASSTLQTVLAATTARTIGYLAIGDSVTANNPSYVNELNTLQAADANLKLTFLGTKSTGGVAHEGISGWTSQQWYAPTTAGDQSNNRFYNPSTGIFDYAYYRAQTGQAAADAVSFHLGINDLGTANSDQAAASRGARCAWNIEQMIASVKASAASARFFVCLTIPPSLHQDGMTSASNNAYAGRRPARRQRRNHIILARELIRRFGGREAENIYIVATNLAIDTERGFPYAAAANASSRSTQQVVRVSDAIHCNGGTGILQLADALWATQKVVFA
ncbi:SGNH/GDSL hydrolase family protein [Novosphingobium kaempferiae]|uniref:SGNH/GDSL hydrolase family protein n=1 Tax=Novosphingobium kaempferiae TaxID=2896849 RepID=UPI001E3D5535|nr:SGNH/GDSL hydrolase family protein [Novosphingobium kaempferiae]